MDVLSELVKSLHFDPVNLIAVVIVGYLVYLHQRQAYSIALKDSQWHTEWIKKHSEECDERERTSTKILTELQAGNSRLIALTEAHHDRIVRLEAQVDRNVMRGQA